MRAGRRGGWAPAAAAVVVGLAGSLLAGPTQAASHAQRDDGGVRAASVARGVPALSVTRVVDGLSIPWDVARLPGGGLLVTERDSARLLVAFPRRGEVRSVGRPSGVWVSGETGLMSVALAPTFKRTGRFYTCHGHTGPRGNDVRVVAWRMNDARTAAREVTVLRKGIGATSGRHGGCRLLIARDGSMYVGTGDAAVSTHPQDLDSLNGKVLRLDPRTGRAHPRNPFIDSSSVKRRFVWTYGHRNLQGLAQRKDGSVWSIEHGTYRDDEVNKLRRRGNYGWNPGPGYDESRPMTDFSLPGRQVGARWSSGEPTIATSGAAWVHGRRWGALRGTLAVAALAASRLVFMKFDARGRLKWTRTPQVTTEYGRLRSVTSLPGGALLVTTSNGEDSVLKVRPQG